MFQSDSPLIPQDLEGLMPPCISLKENIKLVHIPDMEEIKAMIWELNPMKAPGPDGLHGLFFKKYWSIVGSQVFIANESFFREGWMLKELNHTFITLIPKKPDASNFNHFHPRSLCNFYYKVI